MQRAQLKKLLNTKKKELETRIDEIHADVFKLQNTKKTRQQADQTKKEEALYILEESAILELDHISHALERLESDSFDQCTQCSETISDAQFKAIPYTEYCAECAKKQALHTTLRSATH